MEFKIEIWQLKALLDLLDGKKLNLNPPYQRNPIWTKSTQKILIKSIRDGNPIPNLFLYESAPGSFEMVDGQQRTRAIKQYKSTNDLDLTADDQEFKTGKFLEYKIPVTIITKIEPHESVEEFYYMVNSSGIKLNRPETLKAQYFNTKFLELVQDITSSENFQKLHIVPTTSEKRMLDRDLVEELCALILHGITDKKNQVDKMYESDINVDEYTLCKSKFESVLEHLNRFNNLYPLKSTRYRQRNDFYTMFNFLKDNLSIGNDVLDYSYKILLKLEVGIRPSRSACPPLSEYAFNCVSQSNSSTARQKRQEIFNSLLLNQDPEPNATQLDVKKYYPMDGDYFIKIGKYLAFNEEVLSKGIEKKESNNL